MKHKTIYMLVLICTFSFFSSAKQTGKDCKSISPLKAKLKTKPVPQKPVNETEFVIAPVAWIL
jgi:hypothetical protein